MHTFSAKGGARFHFNSDLSGKVIVAGDLNEEARLSFDDLREFVKRHEKYRLRPPAPPPSDKAQFQERQRELPRAKESVCLALEQRRDEMEAQGGLTPYERQMFDVAMNSVKGAR